MGEHQNEWREMFEEAGCDEEEPLRHEVVEMTQRPGWNSVFPINDTDKGEKMLKEFKLLRMKGKYKEGYWGREERMMFNPIFSAWCREDSPNHPAVTSSNKPISDESITNTREVLPFGFINILGEVEFSRMKLKDANSRKRGKIASNELDEGDGLSAFIAHRVATDKKEQQQKKAQRKEAVQNRKATQPLLDDDSDDEEEEEASSHTTKKATIRKSAGGGTAALNSTSGTGGSQHQRLKASLQQTQKLEEKKKKLAAQGLAELAEADDDDDDDIQNIIDLGDDAGAILTSSDIAKFIKQYITRSIVTAARKRGAVITCTDTGGIMRALARGVQSAGVIKSHEMNGLAMTGRIPVLDYRGVEPIEERRASIGRPSLKDEKNGTVPRSEWFTHHVTVNTDDMISTRTFDDIIMKLLDAAASQNKETLPGTLPRQPSRVVGVVIGGTPEQLKFNLVQYAERKWPLLIVEGSGGYADTICGIIRKIESSSTGAASVDDYSSYLSNTDAATSQIISSGVCKIVPKGMIPSEFTRLLEKALSGDEILYRAWESYAAWNNLSTKNERSYGNLMLSILVLGIMATAISILQTFLQLQFQDSTDGQNSNGTRKWAGGETSNVVAQIYASLSIVVVVLPITISLMQSITNKINAGAKWVSLKSASEGLLSEIYMYRAHSGRYAPEKIKKAADARQAAKREQERKEITQSAPSAGAAPDGAEGGAQQEVPQYSTRSELLQLRLSFFTSELVQSEMAENTIPKFQGVIPPHHITKYGDDGFSDISILNYANLRLGPKIRSYNENAARYDKAKTRITLLIYGFGALGTALAALATFEQLRHYNIGAWVALTTSIGNALTRYLDYTKTEWLHGKYTAVMHELQGLQAWWSAKGPDAHMGESSNTMIANCESKITSEIEEFKAQLKIAVAEAAKESEKLAQEREAITAQMLAGEQPELVKKMENLGLENLNSATLLAALKDPTSQQAASLLKLVKKVDDELGGVVDKVRKKAEEAANNTRIGAAIKVVSLSEIKGAYDSGGNIIASLKNGVSINPYNLEKLIPSDFLETIKDVGKRRGFLNQIENMGLKCDPWQINYTELMSVGKKCGRLFKQQLSEQPYRLTIESVGKMCQVELFSQFEDALEKLGGLSPLDFVDSREDIDLFQSEVKKLASLPSSTPFRKLVAACGCQTMKARLSSLNESKVRSMLKRASKIFIETSPTLELMKAVADSTADMDLDLFIKGDDDLRCRLIAFVDKLTATFPEHLLDKDELVSVFPEADRAALKEKPHQALVAMISKLRKGSLGRRMLDNFLRNKNPPRYSKSAPAEITEADFETGKKALGGFPQLLSLLHSVMNQEKFVMATRGFTQIEINNMSKSAIVKKIQNIVGSDPKFIDDVKLCNEKGIKLVMSGIKSSFGNSYSGRVFDILTDEITTFDANIIFNYEDREKIVSRMKDFKGMNIKRRSEDALRSMLGYRSLIEKSSSLDKSQLEEMITRLLKLIANTYNRRVFDKALEHTTPCSKDCYADAGFHSWGDQMIDRFVSLAINLSEDDLRRDEDDTDDQFKQRVCDDEQMFRLTCALTADELALLLEQIRELAGEKVLSNVFEAASRDITTEAVYHIFDSAFMLPSIRHRLVMCMTNLLTEVGGDEVIIHLRQVTNMPADTVVKKLKQDVRFPSPKQSTTGELLDPGILLEDTVKEQILSLCKGRYNAKMIQVLIKIFKGRARFIQVIEFLLGELKITTGYRLFLLLAAKMTTFNLREVVKSPKSRHGLCPLFLRLHWYGKIDSLLQAPPPITKDEIIQELDSHDADTFECVTSDLANLTAYQLLLLMKEFKEIITTTYTGAFFQSLERSIFMQVRVVNNSEVTDAPTGVAPRQTLERDVEKRGRNEAIAAVKNFIRLNPQDVAESLDSFDARLFTSRLATEKKKILSKFISSDSVVNIVVNYDQQDMESFFSYLSSSPQFKKFSDEESDSDNESEEEIAERVRLRSQREDEERARMNQRLSQMPTPPTQPTDASSISNTEDKTYSVVGLADGTDTTHGATPSSQPVESPPTSDLNPLHPSEN
eukprot:TRINITY_DN3883_c0_g1_i1.p1 TRINITY_DN3883_c0_g1~~TRINITY_DN3883_c0_g1_i1.p1  ORF type:complete len:2053 (+),score=501.65 TRINITY_DN3883_c0_g1_i1:165-6323(+)